MSKKVCLGMPGYGSLSAPSSMACWLASEKLEVDRRFIDGSLLARQFNQLWCWALNDKEVTHFAMLHSDVEPGPGWLDILMEELEARDLDVLSAVIPIKSSDGLTSTALHKDGDNWEPLCRLTMKEVYNLPETFTADDLGHPLLVNTGCWVCKFDRAWVEKVHFEINDRIVFVKSSEMYEPQVEPEDWFFSRLCNELNLKVGATRKVQLDHRGTTAFSNRGPWGSDFDTTHVKESVVPKPKFRYPHDVAGWLHEREGRALADLAKDKNVLEIGSYLGKSTICMAQTAKHVTSIDTHDGRGTPVPMDTYQPFLDNLERYGIENVAAYKTSSELPIVHWEDPEDERPYDIVFIDGAHDEQSVRTDLEVALSVVKDDGLIAFHDYSEHCHPDVKKTVDEFIEQGATLVSTHLTVAVVKPPSRVLEEI